MTSNAMRVVFRVLNGARLSHLTMKKHYSATASTFIVSAPKRSPPEPRSQFSHGYRRESSRAAAPAVCLAGVLAFFGLDEPEEDPIVDTIKHGILALQRKEYKKAEQFMHIALKMSQDSLDENAITYCYNVMANIAYEQGDYMKADKLFVETMKRTIANGTPLDDNSIVEMSLKIATVNGHAGIDEKAEMGFKFCTSTQRKKIANMSNEDNLPDDLVKDTHLLLGLSLDNYAHFLLSRGRYAEAKQMWTEALSISRKFLGPEHEQSFVIYNNVALVHQRLGQIDESIKILEEIVSLEAMKESEDLPIFLCNLGMNYLTQKNFVKAEEMFAEARKLAVKFGNEAVLAEVDAHLEILKTKAKEVT